MRRFTFFSVIILILVIAGCQQTVKHQHDGSGPQSLPSTGTFGEAFPAEGALPAALADQLFGETDTVEAILSGNIIASCKHSGCWMDLEMSGQETLHVTFLDDQFAIPLDAAGKNAVVKGIAIRELVPVETLQNYAREDGMSEEEIALITEPEWAYEFIATGVVIEE